MPNQSSQTLKSCSGHSVQRAALLSGLPGAANLTTGSPSNASWHRLIPTRPCLTRTSCPSSAMDRWYGSKGVGTKENAVYIFQGETGLEPLAEIKPTPAERSEWFYHSKHLDMFWRFRPDGKSFLDEKLKSCDIDTVVIAGLWTDECICSTACERSRLSFAIPPALVDWLTSGVNT